MKNPIIVNNSFCIHCSYASLLLFQWKAKGTFYFQCPHLCPFVSSFPESLPFPAGPDFFGFGFFQLPLFTSGRPMYQLAHVRQSCLRSQSLSEKCFCFCRAPSDLFTAKEAGLIESQITCGIWNGFWMVLIGARCVASLLWLSITWYSGWTITPMDPRPDLNGIM